MGKDKKSELAKLLGLDAPDEEESIQEDRADEAVIAYTKSPELFRKVQCISCSREFAVNRRNISCCGRACRHRYLSQLFGINWSSDVKPPKGDRDQKWVERVYGYNEVEPLVVSGTRLDLADELLSSQGTQPAVESIQQPSSTFESVSDSINNSTALESEIGDLLSFDISNL